MVSDRLHRVSRKVKLVTPVGLHLETVLLLPMGYGLWGSNGHVRDRRRHVALKDQMRDPNTLRAQHLKNS